MAIQFRRGNYEDFVPSRLRSGEPAVVISGDPNTDSGKAIYICITSGTVKRLMTYDDTVSLVQQMINEALNE